MKHSPAVAALVASFEGRKHDAYADPGTGGAPWTIGVGHTGSEVHKGLHWTDAQIDAALDHDLAKFDTGVSALLGGSKTTQRQFDALVSLAFNIGLGNLASSTLLKKHKAGDYAGAAQQFVRWNKAAGRVMAGLTRRRVAEAALYQVAS